MKSLLGVLLLSLAFAANAAGPTASNGSAAVPAKVSVSVKPAGDGTYLVESTFTERSSGKVIASPSMVVKAGKWGTVEISGDAAKPDTRLSVSVAPDGSGAAYFAQSKLPNGLIDTQSGTLVLAN